MVDAWGSWKANYGSKRIRLGVTIDPYVYSDRVDFYLGVYLQAEYAISDSSNSFSISGDWSRGTSSISVSTSSGGSTDTLWSPAPSSGHLYRVYGSPGQTVSASVSSSISGLFQDNVSVSVSFSKSATIPAVNPSMTSATAVAHVGYISLSWVLADDGGSTIDYYRIYRNGAHIADVGGSSYTDNVGNGATAYYDVYAHNGVGFSGAARSGTVTTPSTPAAPAVVDSTGGVGTVALDWNAPSNGGSAITGYVLTRNAVSLTTLNSSTTAYTDTGLAPNTTYTYTIAATNAAGTGTTTTLTASTLGGLIGVWDGSGNFVKNLPKVWDGNQWVTANARVWDGTGEWKYAT